MIKATYVNHYGDDLTVVNAARVSFGVSSTELAPKDIKLIAYLAKHRHMSPFEHCGLTVEISCPVYIAAQIMRHRTFSFNMVSRRYTSENLSFYVPVARTQNRLNRQSSETIHPRAGYWSIRFATLHQTCLDSYNEAIADGVSREVARGLLPQNLNTKFVMTGNLRNWVAFVQLRTHEGAQEEVRLIAAQVRDILIECFPHSAGALLQHDEKVV